MCVDNDWDYCRIEFPESNRWMEVSMDEFATPECGWDFDLKRLDEIFEPHMLRSVLIEMRHRPAGHITE